MNSPEYSNYTKLKSVYAGIKASSTLIFKTRKVRGRSHFMVLIPASQGWPSLSPILPHGAKNSALVISKQDYLRLSQLIDLLLEDKLEHARSVPTEKLPRNMESPTLAFKFSSSTVGGAPQLFCCTGLKGLFGSSVYT